MTWLPPPPYDAPAPAYVVEHVLSFEQIARMCGGPKPWACSKVIRDAAGNIAWCDIYLPPIGASRINERNVRVAVSADMQQDSRRHEVGHCNGWPQTHPGGIWKDPRP